MKMMLDALVLGEFKKSESGLITTFVKDENIKDEWLPLFLRGDIDGDVWCLVYEWLKDRVFPKNRIGARKILKDLGLKKYDHFEIAYISRASLVEDPYWIAFEEGDTWSKNTIRGIANVKDFSWNSLNIEM